MPRLIDIHCHFMPYVDDGASDLDEALEALQQYKEQGIGSIILTPHYRRGMFESAQELMRQQYVKLRIRAEEMGLRIYTGCEYHTHAALVSDLAAGRRWTMANSNYVLVEFSSRNTLREIRNRVRETREGDYRPIIAHIERYPAVRDAAEGPAVVEELIELGAFIQINADAVLGLEGRILQKYTKELIEADLVHFIASDSHGTDYRPSHLSECYEYVRKKYGRDTADRLFIENPRRVIRAGARNRK